MEGPCWRPDLHLHTHGSDGRLDPVALVERASSAGVNLMAVTDHDSLASLAEASQAAERLGIRFIPGIEIGSAGEDEVHVLAYFVHQGMAELVALVQDMRADRAQRQPKYLRRLGELGMPLTADDIPTTPGSAFSRSNLARAMVKKGYATDVADAFNRFIGVGQPGYICRHYVSVEDTLRLLRREGAVPVLAHPGLLKPGLAEQLPAWIEAGLMGLEAYHPAHSLEACAIWDSTARSHGLLVTGGSDFHAPGDPAHGEIAAMLGVWRRADEDARALLAQAPPLP